MPDVLHRFHNDAKFAALVETIVRMVDPMSTREEAYTIGDVAEAMLVVPIIVRERLHR